MRLLTRMRVAERRRLRSSVAPPTVILWGKLPYFLRQARDSIQEMPDASFLHDSCLGNIETSHKNAEDS